VFRGELQGRAEPNTRSGCAAFVVSLKTADIGELHDLPVLRQLDGTVVGGR
jgi:hypothetical protein